VFHAIQRLSPHPDDGSSPESDSSPRPATSGGRRPSLARRRPAQCPAQEAVGGYADGGGTLIAVLVLVIMDTVVVVLLAGLVAGLLRSHADILRALHSLGAGVGDPSASPESAGHIPAIDHTGPVDAAPLHIGPPLPRDRDSWSAHDIEGSDPHGDAVALSVTRTSHHTLLAFLSSGCSTCAGFWEALGDPDHAGLPGDVRVVVVTKGPELEIPSEVRLRAGPGTNVVMSSRAWDDYEVPGSPFFVLVDGRTQRRVGEGVARHFAQVVDLVRRSRAEAEAPVAGRVTAGDAGHRLDGKAREKINDEELIAAGIHPGHASLYPQRLDDVFSGTPDQPEDSRPAR